MGIRELSSVREKMIDEAHARSMSTSSDAQIIGRPTQVYMPFTHAALGFVSDPQNPAPYTPTLDRLLQVLFSPMPVAVPPQVFMSTPPGAKTVKKRGRERGWARNDVVGEILDTKRKRIAVSSSMHEDLFLTQMTWDCAFEILSCRMVKMKFGSTRLALAKLDGLVRTRVAQSAVLKRKNLDEMGLWLLDGASPGDIVSVLTSDVDAVDAPLAGEMCFKFYKGITGAPSQVSYAGWDMHGLHTSGGAANTHWDTRDPEINCVFRVVRMRVGSKRIDTYAYVKILDIPANSEATVDYGDEFVHSQSSGASRDVSALWQCNESSVSTMALDQSGACFDCESFKSESEHSQSGASSHCGSF